MRISLRAISFVAAAMLAAGVARAHVPSVADLDATERAAGNRLDVAKHVGEIVFATVWPAQVSQISANALGSHMIVGIRVWGVKFHHPITRAEFLGEVRALVAKAFAAAPQAEEVDLWASVPIAVGKGVIVSGDLAKPTSRTVFSLSAHRGETGAEIASRASRSGGGVFWDQEWERDAFKRDGNEDPH